LSDLYPVYSVFHVWLVLSSPGAIFVVVDVNNGRFIEWGLKLILFLQYHNKDWF